MKFKIGDRVRFVPKTPGDKYEEGLARAAYPTVSFGDIGEVVGVCGCYENTYRVHFEREEDCFMQECLEKVEPDADQDKMVSWDDVPKPWNKTKEVV